MTASSLSICHLGKYYPPAPGGIETHVQTLARAQAALGHQVRVICINHAGDRNQTVEETDGPVHILRLGRRLTTRGFDYSPGLSKTLKTLQNIDILHLHTPNPTMLLALAFARPKTPLVITHHSDIVRQKILKYALLPFESFSYRNACKILSDSPPYIEGSATLRRYINKVETLPLGLDLEPYSNPSPAALDFAEGFRKYGSPLWLGVGRLVYYKGFEVAVRALRNVPGTLLIIGTGPLQAELKTLASTLGVADRTVFLGHASQDQLAGAYLAATAFWFPSIARSEGFGLVQVEAMASGCPVINTAIPASGVAWVSQHDVSGLTVPVGDDQALAAAANAISRNTDLRQRLSAGAAERSLRFGGRLMGEKSIELYGRSIDQASAGVSSNPSTEIGTPSQPLLGAK